LHFPSWNLDETPPSPLLIHPYPSSFSETQGRVVRAIFHYHR
jgi:hypothetical protein